MSVHFKNLLSLEERLSVYPLYHQLNPRMTEKVFAERTAQVLNEPNYRLLAMYDHDELVGISGYWVSHKLYCGKYLEPDNVVIERSKRSAGFGELLQRELENIAKAENCSVMMLDAYLENHRGHQFYEKHGYEKKGYHMIKKL